LVASFLHTSRLEPLSNVAPRVGASSKSYVFVKSQRQPLAMFCEAQSFPIPAHRLVVRWVATLAVSSSLKMAISFPPSVQKKKKKESRCFHFSPLIFSLLFLFPQSSLEINRPSVYIYKWR
jgi:hypothetical protein